MVTFIANLFQINPSSGESNERDRERNHLPRDVVQREVLRGQHPPARAHRALHHHQPRLELQVLGPRP